MSMWIFDLAKPPLDEQSRSDKSPLCLFTSLNKGFKLWGFLGRWMSHKKTTKKTPGFPCFRCRRWWCLEFSRIGTRTSVTWHEMGKQPDRNGWVWHSSTWFTWEFPTKQYSHFIGGYKLTILPGTMQTWSNELATENTTSAYKVAFWMENGTLCFRESEGWWNIILLGQWLDFKLLNFWGLHI